MTIPKSKLFLLLVATLASITLYADNGITLSGTIKNKTDNQPLPFVTVILKNTIDSTFVTGTVSDEQGRFTLSTQPGSFLIEFSYVGFKTAYQSVFVGSLSPNLNLTEFYLEESVETLNEVVVTGKADNVSEKMDKQTYTLSDNLSQSGGSVLQSMQNLPGVTIQDGKVQLRGNDKVVVLIDGKQTALTGFGSQSGLDNIPASAIEKIEIINNPSAKYDANGNAGIINIIYKTNKQEGFNGKVGLAGGLGALWIKKDNLPTIRPQYQRTPKINPSLSLSYRKDKLNAFLQADYLYTETLNKNEFVTRTYDNGTVIQQQTKRNRNTAFLTSKTGVDYSFNASNSLTISGLYGMEKIIDHGDEPFFNADLSERNRLWQFLEDELKTTVMATGTYLHKFPEPGHQLTTGFNYTFHRENEKYFFDNILPTYTGHDAFKLISDENVADFTLDYVKPLPYGRVELGTKVRRRYIPTNMRFFPGVNSPLDTTAGGWANYKETIPALYSNYILENRKYEAEIGLRVEYVKVNYVVNPDHNTYKSNGYDYTQPFFNVRLANKINENSKLSLFYNRRVDRPNEVDIRIFPKYDDAEIIKVGNPALKPQFTNSLELGYKQNWAKGYLYIATYHRTTNGTITRISSVLPGSTLIYAIYQNANLSYNSGMEWVVSQDAAKWATFNLNLNVYRNQIEAFSVINQYPEVNTFSAAQQKVYSGSAKFNALIHLQHKVDVQLTTIYLAPDIVPQGKIGQRFSMDLGLKKTTNGGKGELFANATDILNTMVIRKRIQGDGFYYTTHDYYETQVFRVGYSYKF